MNLTSSKIETSNTVVHSVVLLQQILILGSVSAFISPLFANISLYRYIFPIFGSSSQVRSDIQL